MIQVLDSYPGHAAKGACYITGAETGTITEDGPDGEIVRPERVLVTDTEIDYEGTLCVGEKVVRHMAHLLGMVDGWRVERLAGEFENVRLDRDRVSTELAAAMVENHRIGVLLAERPLVKVYVAIDGTEHDSLDAAQSTTARRLDLNAKAVVDARPIAETEAPAPEGVPA